LRRNLKSTVLTTSTMSAYSLSLSLYAKWLLGKKAVYSGRPFTDPFCYTSATQRLLTEPNRIPERYRRCRRTAAVAAGGRYSKDQGFGD